MIDYKILKAEDASMKKHLATLTKKFDKTKKRDATNALREEWIELNEQITKVKAARNALERLFFYYSSLKDGYCK